MALPNYSERSISNELVVPNDLRGFGKTGVEQPAEPKEIKNRITVVETIYHQEFGENPVMVESRYSRELESYDQPYERKLTATTAWTPLDTGWIKECGLLVIKNRESHMMMQIPTPEEKEELAKKILTVSYRHQGRTGWLILPGETMKAHPNTLGDLGICSLHGNVKYKLYLYPK